MLERAHHVARESGGDGNLVFACGGARQYVYQRFHAQPERDICGNGISGDTHYGLTFHDTENGGLTGLCGESVQINFAQRSYDFAGVVFRTRGASRVDYDYIAFRDRFRHRFPEKPPIVAYGRVDFCFAAAFRDERGKKLGIAFEKLSFAYVLGARHHFVARGDHADYGSFIDFDYGVAARVYRGEILGAYPSLRREYHLAFDYAFALDPDVLPGACGRDYLHVAHVARHDVFYHYHRVELVRYGIAGIDVYEIPSFFKNERRFLARFGGRFRGNGYAVHGGGVVYGVAELCVDRAAQHSAERVFGGYRFRARRFPSEKFEVTVYLFDGVIRYIGVSHSI